MTTQLNCKFFNSQDYLYEEHSGLQSALKPLYTLVPSVRNVMSTVLVDPLNTPINEIIERRKLRDTTCMSGY